MSRLLLYLEWLISSSDISPTGLLRKERRRLLEIKSIQHHIPPFAQTMTCCSKPRGSNTGTDRNHCTEAEKKRRGVKQKQRRGDGLISLSTAGPVPAITWPKMGGGEKVSITNTPDGITGHKKGPLVEIRTHAFRRAAHSGLRSTGWLTGASPRRLKSRPRLPSDDPRAAANRAGAMVPK